MRTNADTRYRQRLPVSLDEEHKLSLLDRPITGRVDILTSAHR
jgi:hypothetical protein